MKPLRVTPTQATAVTPSDPTPGGSGSESDFGPILEAASVSPTAERGARGSRTAGAPSEPAAKDDSSIDPTADAALAEPGRTSARRTSRDSTSAGQQTQADAAAAAALAIAVAVAPRPDAAPATDASSATSAAAGDVSGTASDPALAGVPAAKGRAAVLAEAAPAAPGADAVTLRSPVSAASLAPISPGRTLAAQPSNVKAEAQPLDRTGAGSERASIQAEEARSSDTSDSDADPQSDFGSGSTAAVVPGSALPFASATQAVAHALSAQIQPAGAQPADSASAHGSNSLGLTATADLASTTSAASASGAFGNVTSYSSEGRAAVATPVGQPGFGQEFSERVVVLARGGVQTAQISLEPAGLGPVGVSIQIHGHAASLVFTAQHEATRTALQSELPRLREMFAASGMQLSDASVGGRAQSQWTAADQSPSSSAPRSDGAADPIAGAASADPAPSARARTVPRLVDTYA
jgi:flagellar hook-length control protein FliK